VAKEIFTEDEFLEMVRVVNQEIKGWREYQMESIKKSTL